MACTGNCNPVCSLSIRSSRIFHQSDIYCTILDAAVCQLSLWHSGAHAYSCSGPILFNSFMLMIHRSINMIITRVVLKRHIFICTRLPVTYTDNYALIWCVVLVGSNTFTHIYIYIYVYIYASFRVIWTFTCYLFWGSLKCIYNWFYSTK